MRIIPTRTIRCAAFSLIEMLVSTTVLVLIMGVVLTTLDFVTDSWRRTTASVETFENARAGFLKMNRLLSQATLNTYADYYDSVNGSYRTKDNSAAFVPTTFKRQSELHFLSGPADEILPDGNTDRNPGHAIFFQAPLSHDFSTGGDDDDGNDDGDDDEKAYRKVPELLNSVGFYVEFYDDSTYWPQFVQDTMPATLSTWRFRLIQWLQPTRFFSVYEATNVGDNADNYLETWFDEAQLETTGDRFVVADNVVLLLILPKLDRAAEIASGISEDLADGTHIAPTFGYNSRQWETGTPGPSGGEFTPIEIAELTRNQLPPLLEVVMVAIDEKSALRLAAESGDQVPDAVVPEDERFKEASSLDDDLDEYTKQLAEANLNYRVFRNTVAISSAKWSPEAPTN